MAKICQFFMYGSVALIIIVLRPFVMFTLHMIFDPGGLNQCSDCSTNSAIKDVLPLNIHQVFYNISHSDMSQELKDALRSWPHLNKQFNYRLWNETMVEQLLHEHYQDLEELYFSYNRWIHRVDMARYIILHQYGGIYADIDIECKRNMLDVYMSFPVTTGVVMYYTSPFGVSNDFLITKAKHPFMTAVIRGLSSSYRWYVLPFFTEMFSTGPVYLSARFWSFKGRYDMIVLQDTSSFLSHKTGSSWHEADTKVLWWMFLNIESVVKYFLTCVCIIILMYIVYRWLKRYLSSIRIRRTLAGLFKGQPTLQI